MIAYDNPLKVAPKKRAARIVIDRYETAKRENDQRKPQLDDWYAAYRSYYKHDKATPFRSKLYIPTTYEHLESHLPRLAAARPRIEIWGRGPEDDARARAHRALAFYYWDSLRMDMALVNYGKSALIFGTSWWKVDWRRKTRTRKRKVMEQVPAFEVFGLRMGAREQLVEREVEVRVIDSPTVTLMDPDKVYFDADGYDEETAGWIIEESVMTLNELEEAIKTDGSPLYDEAVLAKLRERAKSGNPVDSLVDDSSARKDDLLTGGARSARPEVDPFKIQYTVLTEWTDDNVRAVIREDETLDPIRNERNELGMKPFVKFTPIPLPNEMNGISMAETLHSIQYSQNILNNARMDHVVQNVHAMHTVRKASGIQPSQLRYRPGGTIGVVNHDDIKAMEQSPLDFTSYREAEYLDGLAQKVSGSTDIYRGIGANSGSTATESSILSQSAASRVGLMFQILSAQSLHRLGKLWIRMSELYMDRPRMLRITGPELLSEEVDPNTGQPAQSFLVTPEELSQGSEEELDLIIDVSQTEPGTRQFKLQRAQQLIQTVAPFVAPGGPIFNRMVKGALEGLGEENADMILGEERQFIQQQQQAAAQAEAQAAGAGQSDGQNLAIQASADARGGP